MNNFKYLLEIAFDGSDYLGWQTQPQGTTVQELIENKLSYLYCNQKISINSSGRTDAGVHAIGMAVTFSPPELPPIRIEILHKALNKILPKSIYVKNIRIVDVNFDARYSALAKAYTYVISKTLPGPFLQKWCWYIPSPLNLINIKQATSFLVGEHDFSSFAVEMSKTKKSPIRTLYRIDIDEFDNFICITFLGNSFLYKMVRSFIGILAVVGQEKISPDKVKEILELKKRTSAFDTAPAKGLFLMKVFYIDKEWEKFRLTKPPFEYDM